MMDRRIILAGGSGFIGRALAPEFVKRGFEVIVLTRSHGKRRDGVAEMEWDGRRPGPWASVLNGAEAVINLAGKSINCPHTPANLREIVSSRVDSVNAIAAAIASVPAPPRVWVQASAVGYYGDTADTPGDESRGAGNDTLANICRQWEAAFAAAEAPGMRKVTLRIGFVLGRDGGALPVLNKMTRLFLGGAAGSGRQYISWIHLADLVAIIVAAVEDGKYSGVYNAVAPRPVTNAVFMRELRRVWHRPWSPPAPALAVKLGARLMGSEGSLALVSQRCEPRRLTAAGFPYRFTALPDALNDLCRLDPLKNSRSNAWCIP
jgi:uncharacterized protein (TIGR01777 family)